MSQWPVSGPWHIVTAHTVTEPPRSISFPVTCDACRQTLGLPYMASTRKGVVDGIRLGIRCRGCGAEWFLDLQGELGSPKVVDADRS